MRKLTVNEYSDIRSHFLYFFKEVTLPIYLSKASLNSYRFVHSWAKATCNLLDGSFSSSDHQVNGLLRHPAVFIQTLFARTMYPPVSFKTYFSRICLTLIFSKFSAIPLFYSHRNPLENMTFYSVECFLAVYSKPLPPAIY